MVEVPSSNLGSPTKQKSPVDIDGAFLFVGLSKMQAKLYRHSSQMAGAIIERKFGKPFHPHTRPSRHCATKLPGFDYTSL